MMESMEESAMVPTEDTVEALIDYLVFPLLPIRDFRDEIPSTDKQELLGKQMHAAVILYNYYHRKQFPKLKFLGFESFCKAASIAKPALLMYMRYMRQCEEDLNDVNNQLSIAEKMAMDACGICTGLDASKYAPDIEGWPISKVAVFLVDATKKKCLLQYCYITQGVWSLVEKALEAPYEKMIAGLQMKIDAMDTEITVDGTSGNEAYENEEVLEQLAFSTVEQQAGVRQSDLSILERHLTYSLSHEKTTTRLYIMKYERAVNEDHPEILIENVISSLKGPIVKGGLTPEVTPVVEYYHILPYVEIISDWLSRESTRGSLYMPKQPVADEKHSSRLERMSLTENPRIGNKSDLNDQLNIKNDKMNKSESEARKIIRNRMFTVSGSRSSGAVSRQQSGAGSSCMEPDRLNMKEDRAVNDKPFKNQQSIDILNSKKSKTRDAITYNRKAGSSMNGPSGAIHACKVVEEMHCLESDGMPANEDHEIQKKSDMNEQNVNIKNKKTIQSEPDNIIKSTTDLPSVNESAGEVDKLQEKSGGSCKDPDSPIDLKDQAMNSKSFQDEQTGQAINYLSSQIGKTKDVNGKDNRIKDGITSNMNVSGTSISGSSEAAYSCEADRSSLDLYWEPSRNEEDTRGENSIPDNYIDQSKKHSIQKGATVPLDGFEDKAGAVESVKETCMTKSTHGGRICTNDAHQDGIATGDLPLVPMQFSSDDHGSLYHVMESDKHELIQASLRVLQNKRDELCRQQRLLDEEFAQCELHIQKILSEGEDNWTPEVESIIKAYNALFTSQVQVGTDLSSEERYPALTLKRRKLSEAVLMVRNPCQELDEICRHNSWILPRYSVLPSFADGQVTGKFQASVTVQGVDFEFTGAGDPMCSPSEARDSAATLMLCKLRSVADQGH